jgi:hypothetical protein
MAIPVSKLNRDDGLDRYPDLPGRLSVTGISGLFELMQATCTRNM